MYKIERVIFVCKNQKDAQDLIEIKVKISNHQFSELELTQIVHRGILSCFEPPFYIKSKNTIVEPNPLKKGNP